jgi:hypothetical protein
MNKFESSLLQTLSSIDESLKILATGKQTAAAKPAVKAVKKAKKAANGKLPKAVGKATEALEARNG